VAKKLLTIAIVMLFAMSIVALARTPTQHEPIENPQYTPVYERGEFIVNGFSSGDHQVISSAAADVSRDTSDVFHCFLWADSVTFFYYTAGADAATAADSIFEILEAQDEFGFWHTLDTLAVAAYATGADDSSTTVGRSIVAIVGTAEVYAWMYKGFRIVHLGVGTTTNDTVFGMRGKWQRGL